MLFGPRLGLLDFFGLDPVFWTFLAWNRPFALNIYINIKITIFSGIASSD